MSTQKWSVNSAGKFLIMYQNLGKFLGFKVPVLFIKPILQKMPLNVTEAEEHHNHLEIANLRDRNKETMM